MIVKVHIFSRQPPQVALAEDDDMVEALATDTAYQPLTDGIRLRRCDRRVQQTDARSCRHVAKRHARLIVVVAN